MAIQTYLQLVQDILNDMDSDPVTTITETEESRQVVQIIKTVYFSIVDSKKWPHFNELFNITETSAATPTKMTIGTDVVDLRYVKYETATDTYTLMRYLEPQKFMNILDARTTGFATVTEGGIKFKFLNTTQPTYYTSFDEQSLWFDGYDSGTESFLATAKTQCFGMKYPTVTESDGFNFDLPVDMYTLLLAEAKAISFLMLKQVANPAAEFLAQAQRAKFQLDGWKIRDNFNLIDTTIITRQNVQQPPNQQGQ